MQEGFYGDSYDKRDFMGILMTRGVLWGFLWQEGFYGDSYDK